MFVKFINDQLIYKKKESLTKKYLSKINLNAVNSNFYEVFNVLEPFGPCNEKPFFLIENIKILKTSILKNKYISCLISSSTGKTLNAISFNLIDSEISKILLNYKNKVNIIAEINLILWNGKKSLQLNIQDIII